MHIEAYERLRLDITQFDVEDVITTSGEQQQPPINNDPNEYIPMP